MSDEERSEVERLRELIEDLQRSVTYLASGARHALHVSEQVLGVADGSRKGINDIGYDRPRILAELDAVEAERDSLRGVVRQIREVRGCLGAGPMDYEAFVDEIDRALAVAADAPQPEGEVRCWAHEPSESCDDCEDNPVGPQPARCEHKYRGYHEWRDLTGWHSCPGPSPAVLPEKEQR